MNRLACPHCLSPDHLGENIIGWRGVKAITISGGEINVEIDPITYGPYDVERDSFFCSNESGPGRSGCNVALPLRMQDLVQIDAAGKRVYVPITGQESLL